MKTDAIVQEALEEFKESEDASSDNRTTYVDNIEFARLGEQWDDAIAQQRAREQRPMLTINRLPSFARQVINMARQNKPSINVKPATGGANKLTAIAIDGLIRQIQNQSNAKVAYDTAIECAVYGGFGYYRVDVD